MVFLLFLSILAPFLLLYKASKSAGLVSTSTNETYATFGEVTPTPTVRINIPLTPLNQAKLDYLYSKLSEKEKCRIEQPILWPDYYGEIYVSYSFAHPTVIKYDVKDSLPTIFALSEKEEVTDGEVRFALRCNKYLEKTKSKYVIP